MTNFNYDSEFDILYISLIPNEPSIGLEEMDGIIIRRSRKDSKIIGITIFDFKLKLMNNSLESVLHLISQDNLNLIFSNNLMNSVSLTDKEVIACKELLKSISKKTGRSFFDE